MRWPLTIALVTAILVPSSIALTRIRAQDGTIERTAGFPTPGEYDVTVDDPRHPRGGTTSRIHLVVSSRALLRGWLSRDLKPCETVNVAIDGGRFSAAGLNCHTPDRDLNHMQSRTSGTFSETSLDVDETFQLYGVTISRKTRYRLFRADA